MVKEQQTLLTGERFLKLESVIERHKDTKGALTQILNESQKIFGCIPMVVQKRISEALGIPLAEIYGVISFYSHFSIEPKGKNIVSICMGTACYVKNAQKILEEVRKETNTEDSKTSPDGKFTVEATRCIGACGLAPIMTINNDVYGHLSADQVAEIVAQY